MRMKHALVAAASGLTLVLAGPATGASAVGPELRSQIAQELRGDLGDLGDVELVAIDFHGGLVNIEDVVVNVENINIEALNDIVVNVLNDVNVNIQNIDVDVNIEDNVVVVNKLS
jgi:hypothetical protein